VLAGILDGRNFGIVFGVWRELFLELRVGTLRIMLYLDGTIGGPNREEMKS
jgi:hypothetical protein